MLSKCSSGGAVVRNTPTNAEDTRDTGLMSGSGRSPGVGNGNPFQYSCLGNPMVGAWWAAVHGVAKAEHDLATKQHLASVSIFH